MSLGGNQTDAAVHVTAGDADADVLLVCEHASNHVPEDVDLGVGADVLDAHVAWDPGALRLAEALAQRMGAGLVAGGISRLVYDCNRAPDAPDAVPARSEVYTIPGNAALSDADRAARVERVYAPFHAALSTALGQAGLAAFVTVHSFTPIYRGVVREVEIGVLHGADTRLAEAMMAAAGVMPFALALNAPYSAEDGVTHTLDRHGRETGLPGVMLEIRNDLLVTDVQIITMADLIAPWLVRAQARLAEESAR